MGVAIKVFAYYKPEQININELYEQIKESFITVFKGEIEIVKNYSSCFKNTIIGKENPDKIISAAQKWNEDIEQKVVKSLEVLEEKASDCGYKNLSEYFNCSFHNKERSSYSWDLWSSLRSMDDILGYGTDCAVYDENGNWTVMMPEVIKKEALSHPENFVILQLIYD